MTTAKIVIGANYGDEGKGTVVAHYTRAATVSSLNILTNGGAQRAHSIITKDGSFTFQHFGSGTAFNADNYFSQFFILNPMQFINEYNDLHSRIVVPSIYRHPQCMWTTPFDQMFNLSIEEQRGKNRHGSCGMGIWETILRYKSTITISFDAFINLEKADKIKYLLNIKKYFENRNVELPTILRDPWNSDFLIEHFISDCEFLYSHTIVANLSELKKKYEHFIFENGQGLLLNDDPKNVHTTPSNTGLDDSVILLNELEIKPENVSVHYVTRPYMTRHGNGSFNAECDKRRISSSILEDRTNHYNKMQGNFRYGELNIQSLTSRVNADFVKLNGAKKFLEVTHCDEMDRMHEFSKFFQNCNAFDSPLII